MIHTSVSAPARRAEGEAKGVEECRRVGPAPAWAKPDHGGLSPRFQSRRTVRSSSRSCSVQREGIVVGMVLGNGEGEPAAEPEAALAPDPPAGGLASRLQMYRPIPVPPWREGRRAVELREALEQQRGCRRRRRRTRIGHRDLDLLAPVGDPRPTARRVLQGLVRRWLRTARAWAGRTRTRPPCGADSPARARCRARPRPRHRSAGSRCSVGRSRLEST